MASTRIAAVAGESTTGALHGLLIETTTKGSRVFVNNVPQPQAMVTITGHDGKKRHASVLLTSVADIDAVIAALTAAKASL